MSALLVYGGLAVCALIVFVLDERPLGGHPEPWLELEPSMEIVVSLSLAAVLVALGVGSTRVLVRRTPWARRLHVAFRELLVPLSSKEIVFFAISSGIAEELFFRGALQPWAGFAITSVVFGLVHLGPSRAFWPWTVWAVVMGFLLGAIYECTGQLIGPVVAHVLINYENLHFINSHDPLADAAPKGLQGSSLVGGRERGGGSRSWH
ncbi:MAG: CPBP family intramembrane glutamic endopeptidase [Myxococcota bacterium]